MGTENNYSEIIHISKTNKKELREIIKRDMLKENYVLRGSSISDNQAFTSLILQWKKIRGYI